MFIYIQILQSGGLGASVCCCPIYLISPISRRKNGPRLGVHASQFDADVRSWFCTGELMQARVSQKRMWHSFITSVSHLVRVVGSIRRTTPIVYAVSFLQPMAFASKGCGKRWQTPLWIWDQTPGKHFESLRTLHLDSQTSEQHAMLIVFCNAFI